MISYDPGKWGICFACTLRGSVFPKAAVWAFPCSILSVVLHKIVNSRPDLFSQLGAGDTGASVLSGFTFILGFLVVFRSQQAFSRWWEGGTLLQQLRGEWFNAFSSLMAFSNQAPEKEEDVAAFQHRLARLFSLLYSAALSQVSTMGKNEFELIDIEDFDPEGMAYLMQAHDRCEVCLQWIQRLIGDANDAALLKVAPPILSRVYNQLGNGIVNLNNARKITEFPIPFPLAQMIAFMLWFHWLITAFICAASVERSFWAGILSFIVTFSFWSINYIAVELEQPFGDDANDLPLYDMQADLNLSLRSLMDRRAQHPPAFSFKQEHKLLRCRGQTMEDIFANHPKKQTEATSFDTSPASPDNEKTSGNAMVLQTATTHGAWLKEKSVQMMYEPPVGLFPSVTPEIWFHMSPRDNDNDRRPDVEASWKPQSALSVAPVHSALPLGGAPAESPQLQNALPAGGALTLSPQVSPLPDLPVKLQPPPVWEPSPLSVTLTLADPMLGGPTSTKPRPAYRAPDTATTTRDAAGLSGRLQALQERNDAASFPAALAGPSTVWGSNEHDSSDQVRVTRQLPSVHEGISSHGVQLGGGWALTRD